MAEKTTKKASYGKKFISAFIVTVFTVFTLLFFNPLEIYFGNAIEFSFSTELAALILFIISAVFSLLVSAAVSFLPTKILRPFNIAVFGVGFCSYIQSLLLNGSMGSLTGDKDNYSTTLIIVNILIWAFIFAALITAFIIFKKRKKSKSYFFALRYVALTLVAIQLVSLAVSYISVDKSINKIKDVYVSNEGKLDLSPNENVVYFIIDTCDGSLVEEALKDYPDMFSGFGGFTYFPNMSTTHSRTYPSLTYLLTGQKCYFDKPYTDYVNDAFKNSSFINDIDALGADIRLYTEAYYIGETALDKIDNIKKYDSSNLSSMNIWGFLKQTVKVSGYKSAPYLAKEIFSYTTNVINNGSLKAASDKHVMFDDVGFYQQIINTKLSVNKNYTKSFRLYHMYGSHAGTVINENCEYEKDVPRSDATRGSLKLIESYINQMKQNGTFDNTTIIITADHGFSVASEDLSLTSAPSCILLVKPKGANGNEKMKTSLAPVCHEDLFATVIDGLGGDSAKYGRTVFEIEENEDRERKYYHTALVSDKDGEVALREYSIKGDARKLESYSLTGNYWDVKYSKLTVSEKRLKDFIK